VRLLTTFPPADLAAARADLEALALGARRGVTRELGFVALIAADRGVDPAWAGASRSARSLTDLLHALPLVGARALRAALYPRVLPLLDGLPPSLGGGKTGAKGGRGRYVRIELRGRRTLTLAEVEVISDGRNVARAGKATQKNTAYDGNAARAIDGNKSTAYGDGGQTHTEEETPNPWWELDLGSELPIDEVIVYNRDEDLSGRLRGFTLRVLDAGRNAVFEKTNQPAPATKVAFEVGGGRPEGAVRRAAMAALPAARGPRGPPFQATPPCTPSGQHRPPPAPPPHPPPA